MNPHPVLQGSPYPLGATWEGNGVNFALFSEHAPAVDLCLFDGMEAPVESAWLRMEGPTDHVWHLFLPEARPGQLYGYRVHGPYAPERGARFNASKLMLDPYAKAVTGHVDWSSETPVHNPHKSGRDVECDYRDNAWAVPKSVVVDPAFDWGEDRHPRTPLEESVIYEVHVKGFSKICPQIPEGLRGSYEALGSPVAIDYFRRLGVTAVELLPVHQHVDDRFLLERGLTNYWGYNTIGFFAPESSYSSSGVTGGQVAEFKRMVKNLHAAGIEVILDVVYNHTAEGNHLGPTLCFRGIDNAAYYRLQTSHPRHYADFTGCGNTLDTRHSRVIQLIMDSLRYWVEEMHVDGFRFDLATALARETDGFSRHSGFFNVILQDPVLSRVKLIAEPWDLGEGGYRVGDFPAPWAEWNGKYRDTVRSYWKGDGGHVHELASRLAGSADLYRSGGRRPSASINFVTAHDGFTLADLVAYNEKRNEANCEKNRDGDNHNRSWNCGAEGATADEKINALRRRQQRNFLATLFLSQGVPMLCAGDEYGRTQHGNNNAYCQDNEMSWLEWERDGQAERLLEFTRRLIRFRREHPIFHRRDFFLGRKIRGSNLKDLTWINPGGKEMTHEEWHSHFVRCLGMMIGGRTEDEGTFLLLFNAHHEPMDFVLPDGIGGRWELLLSTTAPAGFLDETARMAAGDRLRLVDRSFSLLRATDFVSVERS